MGNTAQHCRLGFFQDSVFAGDLEDWKSTSGRNLMYLWKSNICSHKLDVQETCIRIRKFYIIRNHFVGCSVANVWSTCSWFTGYGERSVTFIEQYLTTNSSSCQKTVHGSTNPNPNKKETEMWINCRMWTTSPRTHLLLKLGLSWTSVKTTKEGSIFPRCDSSSLPKIPWNVGGCLSDQND